MMSPDKLAAQDSIYIPPPGLAFRLLGYLSQKVVYSRTHRQPEVGQHPSSETFADHWFTLLHGTGAYAGLYAIKSRHTGKVLFSRRDQEPRVYHVDGDGQYKDKTYLPYSWFELEPGKGQYAKYFRLITPSQGMALFSRTHLEPYLYNHPANEIFADHHFSFLFEDVQIDKVDYELEKGQILSTTLLVLADQTLNNTTSQVQEMNFSVNSSVTNTSSFKYSTGFTISIGMEFSARAPIIAEPKTSVNTSTSNQWKWGQSTSYTTSYTANFPAKASPGEKVRAVSTVNQGILDVPFTVHLSSKSAGVKVETKGTWRGVSTWDLRHTVETVK